ncbi:MAG: ActS/PrrB/RegB family redox-sensitive histidine kinase [Hyphomicrobiaceae bacterium]
MLTLQGLSKTLDWHADSRLRLVTIVRLRWLAILGQLMAICIVHFGLGFDLPLGSCLSFIALSAWLNVYLVVRFPARHRVSIGHATMMLAYDLVQLSALLYLTGGVENPFMMVMLAPVTVSAGSLPPRNTVMLGMLTTVAVVILVTTHLPLPYYPGMRLDLPILYQYGYLAAVAACMLFMALYASRLARESRQMSAALAATDQVLAREQKLHALDGLAAAAAHELGTPLSTIVLVAKELERDATTPGMREDLELLRSQALRCREILAKLTKRPSEQDPLHAHHSVGELLDESAAPYRSHGKPIRIQVGTRSAAAVSQDEPVGERRPGVIYGLGNLIENAIDFAKGAVEIRADWNDRQVEILILDDGPGFPADVIESLGEPYVTTRANGGRMGNGESTGMGLGFFIAKTLLERSGATITLANRTGATHGAAVRISWPRAVFEAPVEGRAFRPGAKRHAGIALN